MKKMFLLISVYFFVIATFVFAKESQEELKAYLSDMNKIAIEVEGAIRNLSIKIFSPKNTAEQISASIEKFQILKVPSIFSKAHNTMLSGFKNMRDGLELLARGENEKSVIMVREGATFFKKAAISIKNIAESEKLIPHSPRASDSKKAILPPQTLPSVAVASPTPSPHIASPDMESVFIANETVFSSEVNLSGIPDVATIPEISSTNIAQMEKRPLPAILVAMGEIATIKPHMDYFVIKVKDNAGKMIEMDLKPQSCSIMRDNNIVGVSEINKGTAVYILYSRDGKKNQATFIGILKSKDAEGFNKSIESRFFNPDILRRPAQ